MGLSRTISETNGDYSRKSQNFPTPMYLGYRPRSTGSPGNWVPALGAKQLEWQSYGPRKKFDDIFSCLDTIQYTNVTDGQTLAFIILRRHQVVKEHSCL